MVHLEYVDSVPEDKIDVKSINCCQSNDKVFKDECIYCFRTPYSEGGIFVCLETFAGFCLKHVLNYINHYEKKVFLNISKKKVEKEISEPQEKISKLAIGVVGGAEYDNIEEITEYFIGYSRGNDMLIAPITSIKGTALMASIESVIRSDGVKLQERLATGVSEWDGEARVRTKHANLEQLNNGKIIPTSGWECEVEGCGLKENLWLNLTDGAIRCGRSQFIKEGVITKGNSHMKEHYEITKYPLVVKLGTVKDGDGDIFSYDEDANVYDPNLIAHLAHFGINANALEKTEKSTLEMELDMNQQWEWSKCQEGGATLESVYGPGFTGLVNIGSSCYINSVIQMLSHTGKFKERFGDRGLELMSGMSPISTHDDVFCQLSKLVSSMWSGDFSNQEGPDQGIKPTQFKKTMGKGHVEFSTARQQDAEEYLRHIFEVIDKGNSSVKDTLNDFKINLETRFEDGSSHKVKYRVKDEVVLSLPIPFEKSEEIINDETKVSRKRVKLEDCIEAAFDKDVIYGFISPITKVEGEAYTSIRMLNMPKYVIFQVRKFEITPQYTIKKMDIDIEVPHQINLEPFRGKGKLEGEELLPEDDVQIDTCNSMMLGQIMDMGFSEVASRKALRSTGNADVNVALYWLMEHADDPDLNIPIPNQPLPNGTREFAPNLVSQITCLGFDSYSANYALEQTNGDVNSAAELLFTNPGSVPLPSQVISTSNDTKQSYEDNQGNYVLKAFISHMGTSPHSGHYVVHIRIENTWYIYNDEKVAISQNPPFSLGYIYMYERV
ncbi:Ubiquitin carboxyl-terminal hydrolase [Strongyloides ratti]|uniref:Ubiquitin carboxyl-terminal hydrolase n=1 Tax=Strongyloides ratti TaxID=34506 RepID=A0A090L7S7_STRRB|nr:Ubiquitin carboxyl-terminal hydrolase [Strongyloides ratti]CEF65782.1 Ubiquitin carboxyl-terminal hydrolase [Strongyloides ratti]